ncbi:MAG: site-specific DNA-methyltransferase [Chloroflexi bacterium]|nr:site-specific DNA-methyltransferase [Chloroflexota bacterium]MBI4761734.1 site-specific DNA-methyltransferase [Chloroflexota bacterium]
MTMKIINENCLEILNPQAFPRFEKQIALTFLDPPFNQGKEYDFFEDALPQSEYWEMMQVVCGRIHQLTSEGGAIYFMQREKNTEFVLRCLRETGWTLQNLIVWTKRTSAVPGTTRFGKQYQIIAFATKGKRPRVFNRLRIDLPLRPEHKYPRDAGVFVTDVWDDIRELTSGYFAGDEALRLENGERAHKQQAPIALLLRIILSSTRVGDVVLDPFAGTGTTLIVAKQLGRDGVGIEVDPKNTKLIQARIAAERVSDAIEPLREYYRYTPNLAALWPSPEIELVSKTAGKQLALLDG